MSKAQRVNDILAFVHVSERIKTELRHSWVTSGRQESVADHSWHMALLALLTYRDLEHQVDITKVLKMSVVHDLVEAEAGDVPFTDTGIRRQMKKEREQVAMHQIIALLSAEIGQEFADLWCEFEDSDTIEAKFVRALDNLEVQIQHNLADLSTWEDAEYDLVYTKMNPHCAHDAFLLELCVAVQGEAESKWKESGMNPNVIRQRVGLAP